MSVNAQIGTLPPAVGEAQGEVGVLLDHQHRRAVAADPGDDLERGLDDGGRQAERGLVEHDQPRARHQRSRDREHLLLAS